MLDHRLSIRRPNSFNCIQYTILKAGPARWALGHSSTFRINRHSSIVARALE